MHLGKVLQVVFTTTLDTCNNSLSTHRLFISCLIYLECICLVEGSVHKISQNVLASSSKLGSGLGVTVFHQKKHSCAIYHSPESCVRILASEVVAPLSLEFFLNLSGKLGLARKYQ